MVTTGAAEPVSDGADRAARSGGRIKSLDGLRAIAILCVLFDHMVIVRRIEPHLLHVLLLYFASFAHLGVMLFFLLSGFLITGALKSELERGGRLNLGRFYGKRVRRILPAFYLYLAVIAGLMALGLVGIEWSKLIATASFAWNVGVVLTPLRPDDWFLAQFWSLALEGQFYFLWPLILICAGVKRGPWAAAGLAVLFMLFRAGEYLFWPASRATLSVWLHSAGDPLMLGCLIALLAGSPRFERLTARLRGRHAAIALGWVALANPLLNALFGPAYKALFGSTANALALAAILIWVLKEAGNSAQPATRLLNSAPLVYIGTISYSLYVWSTFFITGHPRPWSLPWAGSIVAIAVAGAVSYHFVERPFLSRRRRGSEMRAATLGLATGAPAARD